ncbi:tetratricopeptide repeat protein [Shewanella sp. YIC-542]|uniref:tetratricopeptide repeat protein n=1 Tax=Shewanella mytili TaxID=3377111 RepID=UPI00398EA411
MSVVNQMLKDLDKRQQPHTLAGVPQGVTDVSHKTSLKPLMTGLLLGVVLVAGAFVAWSMLAPDGGDADPVHTDQPLPATASLDEPSAAPFPSPSSMASQAPRQEQDSPQTSKQHGNSAEASLKPKAVDTAIAAVSKPSVTQMQPLATADVTDTSNAATDITKPTTDKSATPHTDAPSLVAASVKPDAMTGPAAANRQDTSSTVKPNGSKMTVVPVVSLASAKTSRTTGNQLQITEVTLTPAQLAQKQYQAGMTSQQRGDMDKAQSAFKRALEIAPATHDARTQLAALYYGAGQLQEAATLLQQGVNRYPSHTQYWLLLGRVQLAQGQSQQAINSLQQIGDGSPLAVDKWLTLAKLGQQQQDWPLVQQSYRKLLDKGAADGRWWLGLAHAQDAAGDYSAAMASYRQALQSDNLSLDARAYIENRMLQIGDHQ